MPGAFDSSDASSQCGDALREATLLLGRAKASSMPSTTVRLRLARDELSTKVLKLRSAEQAGQSAARELATALTRLSLEIETTRRAATDTEGADPRL